MPRAVEWALVGVAAASAFYAALPWLVRPFWEALLRPRYRIRVTGIENVPRDGPALLVANHISWIDGFLLFIACPRRVRFLVNADYVNLPVVRALARRTGLIPVPSAGPRAQRAALTEARAALARGQMVGIFPEGQLSRNGLPGTFRRGLEAILDDRDDIPVIPAALDNLWGSIFSHAGGRFFARWPRGPRRTVAVAFGPPVAPPVTAAAARQAVVEAAVRAFELRRPEEKARPLETLDPTLPAFVHPTLGRLSASTADFDRGGIVQAGTKPGTLGQAAPGVALRVVDAEYRPLPPGEMGRLQALRAGDHDWIDTGRLARIDRDGFVAIDREHTG